MSRKDENNEIYMLILQLSPAQRIVIRELLNNMDKRYVRELLNCLKKRSITGGPPPPPPPPDARVAE
jgi:hypothetical protein